MHNFLEPIRTISTRFKPGDLVYLPHDYQYEGPLEHKRPILIWRTTYSEVEDLPVILPEINSWPGLIGEEPVLLTEEPKYHAMRGVGWRIVFLHEEQCYYAYINKKTFHSHLRKAGKKMGT